ncbi:LacI family DNA-binding transcriptional regulator [Candidatus Chloroploca sp. M-50]|uniref:LacI family DNA-binding transcriptional regulator n=1 Tax=Candidatus Chloroploca mongolica TaxID=2528176 RepID=A0ABS4DA37_9CHLR|nr:LacI family DNA-binding transcriptional regulator [Candidatus Chloroploca mongolica]
MATIDEVAQVERVSPATVSDVLNQHLYLSTATRARVECVTAATGCAPGSWARLRGPRRSCMPGLLITSSSDHFFADPHLFAIIRGIEAAATCHSYNRLFSTAHGTSGGAARLDCPLSPRPCCSSYCSAHFAHPAPGRSRRPALALARSSRVTRSRRDGSRKEVVET